MKSPKDMNRSNAEFWEKKNSEIDMELTNPATAERRFNELQKLDEHAALNMVFKSLDEAINASIKNDKFASGRKKGALGKKQIHINELVKSNPGMSAKELRKIADENILGNIKDGTFENKVVEAHKQK